MLKEKKQDRRLKILVLILEFLALGIAVYIIAIPVYPAVKYRIENINTDPEVFKDIEHVKIETAKIEKELVQNEQAYGNRLIISKIGVNSPIVEAGNAEQGLNRGAWRLPVSSTPDQGGNTVITGHRFKYLPPSNLTFYLFDKLRLDDIVSVIWDNKEYYYQIHKIKIIDKTDVSILEPSDKSILTLFTCHPLFSDEQRIVAIADLMDSI
ncbi:MAG: sortase [bacterium]